MTQQFRGGQKSHKNKTRLPVVDIMQGIAMLWVVVGHHLFDFMPSIYGSIHYYIYAFHMPLFIFISSFLIAYSYKPLAYGKYVYRKFHKFFIPYVVIGVLVTLLAATQNGIDSISTNLFELLISPKQSEATFLWYIYLLFFLYALYPVCIKGHEKWRFYFEFILLIIGIYFYLNPVYMPILCIDYFTRYFLFYVLGVIAAWHFPFLKNHLQGIKYIGFLCFILFVALSVFVFVKPQKVEYGLLCFISIPAMYGVSNILNHIFWIKKGLVSISKNCFHIYLLHMFFIQGLAFIFMRCHKHIESVEGMFFYIIISTVISIVGSIALFRFYNQIRLKIIKPSL